MTKISCHNSALLKRNTPERLAKIQNLVKPILQRASEHPIKVGLLMSPEELNNLTYVRKFMQGITGNRPPNPSSYWADVNVGWKFSSKKRFKDGHVWCEYICFSIRNTDFPFSTKGYNPGFLGTFPMDRRYFLIPSEAITVEEMLEILGSEQIC